DRREPQGRRRPPSRGDREREAPRRPRLLPRAPPSAEPARARPAHAHQRAHPQRPAQDGGRQEGRAVQRVIAGEGAPTADPPRPGPGAPPARRKKAKRLGPEGAVHTPSTFTTTIISTADPAGTAVVWATAGSAGFKGARKGTPFAAQVAAEQAARKAAEMGMR